MYLKPTVTYYRGSAQCARRAPFLILLQPERASIGETCAASNTYAIVRTVALSQLGHFMMGRVNIKGKWRSVSGAYGSDGLPMHIGAQDLPADARPLPAELYDAWNKGGGHNGAGNEASAMRQWAIQQWGIK
jgi:hypothetical protein